MFEKYSQEFYNEVNWAVASFLFYERLQNEKAKDEVLLRKLNFTPISWSLILHSVQVNLFIVLGRLFDTDGDAFSVDNLLRLCISDIDIFSSKELRKRIDLRDEGNIYGDEYMGNVFEPTEEDFQRLRSQVAIKRKIYEGNYRPIRNKLIAHKQVDQLDKHSEFWEKTNKEELRGILLFLYSLSEALQDTYLRGAKLVLDGRDMNEHFFEKDFLKLLEIIRKA
ncbi:MAG: AbiU2 domain-containing protein [Planctomycetota bacterium]